jgi:hypothetical protein
MGVYSKLAAVRQSHGGTVYVPTGYGKPKKYVLWEAFAIEEVTEQDGQFVVSGPGRVLLPPAALSGKPFGEFRAACANFVGFRRIDDLKYTATLKELADAGAGADVVAKGVFAGKPPGGVSVAAWRGVLQRRGRRTSGRCSCEPTSAPCSSCTCSASTRSPARWSWPRR